MKDEKHLIVTTDTFNKMKWIAKTERRTMKAVTTRLIEKEYDRVQKASPNKPRE